jgi:hypothetical protein
MNWIGEKWAHPSFDKKSIVCFTTVLLENTLSMALQRMVLILMSEQYQHFDRLLTDFQITHFDGIYLVINEI